ncbi:MAG: hypothetical protein EHM58_06140 [Ignavibacteriae bacterium]|nr:MAG: hypothetical protein EHM58_06140 [Ignavibacteriota bacterium]
MLKLKLALLSSFIISLILFISCTDNPMNDKIGFQAKGQSGSTDESCSTCWLIIFDHLNNNQPVPYAHVYVKYLPTGYVHFNGDSDENGLTGFYWEGMDLPVGWWRVDASTPFFEGHNEFYWDGESYKYVDVLMIGVD